MSFSFYLTGADNRYHLTKNAYDHFIIRSEIRVLAQLLGAHVQKTAFSLKNLSLKFIAPHQEASCKDQSRCR